MAHRIRIPRSRYREAHYPQAEALLFAIGALALLAAEIAYILSSRQPETAGTEGRNARGEKPSEHPAREVKIA